MERASCHVRIRLMARYDNGEVVNNLRCSLVVDVSTLKLLS